MPRLNMASASIEEEELRELFQFAVTLAREAGEITRKYFRKSPETNTKSDGSLVTVADREAESHLRQRIANKYPKDGILGEEGGEQTGESGRRWIVDPIDGTFSFVQGVPLYGVLIGFEVSGSPTIGVINLPALDEIVYAATGLGCFLNGVPTRVSETNKLEEALLLCTDFSTCAQHGFGRAADELQRRAKASRTWGDCYGHVLVATGRADVMLDPIMNIWDCAALAPVVEEAGGVFVDWKGERTIRGGNAISTNGVLIEDVMEIIRRHR